MHFDRDVPLAPLTTLRLGGSAARVAVVERESDLVAAFSEAAALGAPVFVLGGGSNLVVADEGWNGLVVRMATCGARTVVEGGRARVTVAAGERWDAFVDRAVADGLTGIECLAGIPGLVGATPIQNVGAYGQEVKDTVSGVRAYDRETRAFVDLTPAECAFGYRTSRLKTTGRYVVTEVTFTFAVSRESAPIRYPELARALGVGEGETAPLDRVRDTVVALRRGKGMVLDPLDPDTLSAGSFFVNPVVDAAGLTRVEARARILGAKEVPRYAAGKGLFKVPAAWLIERAGFARGYGGGRVGISGKHTLALVHRGGGTTRELLELAREIQRGVTEAFGVHLEPEPVMLGCAL